MAAACPILDGEHLARQTFGDAALEREVLALFTAQLNRVSIDLEDDDSGGRSALLHGLKGSARAVGAMALAQLAEDLEADCAAGTGALQPLLAATLRAVAARGT